METISIKCGQIEERLNTISKQIKELSDKLDIYDKEIDNRIEKAINNHIAIYHTEHHQTKGEK